VFNRCLGDAWTGRRGKDAKVVRMSSDRAIGAWRAIWRVCQYGAIVRAAREESDGGQLISGDGSKCIESGPKIESSTGVFWALTSLEALPHPAWTSFAQLPGRRGLPCWAYYLVLDFLDLLDLLAVVRSWTCWIMVQHTLAVVIGPASARLPVLF